MEVGDLEQGIDDAVEINSTAATPAVEVAIADTANADFFNEDEDLVPSDNETPEVEQEQDGEESEESVDSDSLYEGNNKYIAALHSWAKENGIDPEEKGYNSFDDANFTEDHLKYVVGREQAMQHLQSTDAALHDIVSKGVSVNDYVNERLQYQGMLNQDDATLVKGNMFNQLVQQYGSMNLLETNEQGQLSEGSYNKIMSDIEHHTSNLTSEQLQGMAQGVRQNINNYINNIPDHLQQRYAQQQEIATQQYEQERTSFIEEMNKHIDKSKNIVVGFADQSARNDFKDYFNEQTKLQEVDVNGQKQQVIPLFHKLQNDSEFLSKMVRLQHMLENGYFTDVKNKMTTEAYRKLSLIPGGKKGSNKRGGNKSLGGIPIANTSSKEFWDE